MKLPKVLREKALKNIAKWYKWVHTSKDNFFFFCCCHWPLIQRKQDGLTDIAGKVPVCDYPGCEELADKEYFPNLINTLKQGEKDIKCNKLYEDDGKGGFKKVKNYGKSR